MKIVSSFSILFCFLCIAVTSCSEGDIIEDNITVSGTLGNCANLNDNAYVFYTIDPETNRSLALDFTTTSTIVPVEVVNDTIVTIILSSTNRLIYREFDSTIDGNTYFCTDIPPNTPTVTRELISVDGTANITYAQLEDNANETKYTRNVTVINTSLTGQDVTYRNESLFLGTDEVTIDK